MMTAPPEVSPDRPSTSFPATAVSIVNYNTSTETLACIRSLAALGMRPGRVLLVDNGSTHDDFTQLELGLRTIDLDVELLRNEENLGFAGASEMAVRLLLADSAISRLLLLNNDAVALPTMVDWLALETGDLAAAKVMKVADPSSIDSMGIVMYRSGLASNRLATEEPLIGPTGGCALYSRRLLEALLEAHGHAFDPAFFCYAEDTDLAMRSLLLGFQPSYFGQAVALHGGQASSGGGFNDFVLYHGIRNSIWVLIKCMPAQLLLRHSPWIIAMYLAIALRHTLRGKWKVVWRLYRDAVLGVGTCWRQRKRILQSRAISSSTLARFLSTRFYDRDYLRNALRELLPWR